MPTSPSPPGEMSRPEQPNLRGQVLYSLKWSAAAKFAGQLVAWGITFFVIRILTPADYGLMAIAEIMIGFAALFREMGLFSAMVQKRDLTQAQIAQSFGMLIVVNSAIFLVVLAAAPAMASFFDNPRLTNIVRVLAIQFPLASVGVVEDAMLNRAMRFKERSLASLAASLANGFATLGFALSGYGVWALVYGSITGAVVQPIAFSVAARHWCWPRFSRKGMGDMLRFGGFVTSSRVLWYVYSKSDVFIIGKLLGKELLGFYSIAMQLAALPMSKVTEMLGQVGFAAYSSIQHDMGAVRYQYLKVIRIISFIAFPVFWGISAISPELVPVVLGKRWAAATVPLLLLGIVMPLRMLGNSSGSVLTAIGKPHIGTLNILQAIVIMPPAFYIGTRYGGITGAALGWVVGYPILVLARLRYSLPPLGLKMRNYFGAMVRPAVGGAAMYGAVVLVRHLLAPAALPRIAVMAVLILTGAVAYVALMWLAYRGSCLEVIDLARKRNAGRGPD